MSGTLMLERWQDRPSRPISVIYKDNPEARWTLEVSDWIHGAYHIDKEEEREFNERVNGWYQPVASTPRQELEPIIATTIQPFKLPAQAFPRAEPHYDLSITTGTADTQSQEGKVWNDDSPEDFFAKLLSGLDSGEANGEHVNHVVLEQGNLQPISPVQTETPERVHERYLPTPDPSPAKSFARSERNGINPSTMFGAQPVVPTQLDIAVHEDIFTPRPHIPQQFNNVLLTPPYTMPLSLPTPAPTPTPGVNYGVNYEPNIFTHLHSSLCNSPTFKRRAPLPMLPTPSVTPVAGSSAQRPRDVERTVPSIRNGRARPYSRRDVTERRPGKAQDVNDLPPEFFNKMKCTECPYVQEGGAGATRSFKRHLATHATYKKTSWVCRGILQFDGTYAGGCSKEFSRKDALQRHINNQNPNICVSDYVPIVDE